MDLIKDLVVPFILDEGNHCWDIMQVDAKTPSFSSTCMPIIVEVVMSWKANQDRSCS